MKCLLIHNRRTTGPKQSSWWTYYSVREELKKRGYLLAQYSVDYDFTDDDGNPITDEIWKQADFIYTVFRSAYGPLKIAQIKNIPSILEINYACSEIATPFMEKELDRLNISKDEIMYESPKLGKDLYLNTSYIVGNGNYNYTEKTYRDFGIEKVKMFRAGIDYQHFKPNFEARGKDKIRFTLTAATLNFRKGIIHLSRAWQQIPKKYHEKIELHLFGNEPTALDSKKDYEILRKFPNVFYHGFISNRDPIYTKEHAISDVMISPTFAEGQSGTVLEGLSFGLYPIVSPFTGVDFDNISSKVLSENPEMWVNELKEAIINCVDSYKKIQIERQSIRDHIVKYYNWDSFAKSVVDLMETIKK